MEKEKNLTSSFLKGVASIFDFNPDLSYIYDKTKTPEERIRKHWEQVGTHMREAMNQFEQEQKISHSKKRK